MDQKTQSDSLKVRFPDAKYLWPTFVDLRGVAMGRILPFSEENLSSLITSGTGFGGAAMVGMGQGPQDPALMAVADTDSVFPLPWDADRLWLSCDLFNGGVAHPYCARSVLKNILHRAREAGFEFNIGVELEHFLVRKDLSGHLVPWDPDCVEQADKLSFTVKATEVASGYLKSVLESLTKLGWSPLAAEKEEGPGQYEINLRYDNALRMADKLVLLKHLVANEAKKWDALVTFMPKPFADRTGSGLHFHFNLTDAKGNNLFRAGNEQLFGISQLGYWFIGGILKHARALCAFTNPTVNCYKRLVGGNALTNTKSGNTWTPAGACFGGNNRTVMIRAVDHHFEDRSPSPLCNPYLAFAAYLVAGLDGVKNQLEPGFAVQGNLYEMSSQKMMECGVKLLPRTLREATKTLQEDLFFRGALGPIVDEVIKWQEQQWSDFHRQISAYEFDEYLRQY